MPLFDAPRLIADVGSTFARCALELETGVFTHQASLSCADYPSLEAAVIAYLQTVQPLRVEHAAVAMANPVEGDQVRMTNYHWQFSIEETRLRLGLTTLVVVNDFTALAMALPRLGAQDYRQIGGGCVVQHSVKGLLGSGSGLGMSGLIPAAGGWTSLGSEGGHTSFAPHDEREIAVLRYAWRLYPHVSFERLVSASGLPLIYRALSELDGQEPQALTAPEITRRALEEQDPACVNSLNVFCGLLGTAAGNLAVTLGATGGIYIGGNIVPRLGGFFDRSPFRERFEDKGRFHDYVAQIPTFVVTAADATLTGAAAILDVQLRALNSAPGATLLSQIRRARAALSPAELRVADLVLERPRAVLSDPIHDIALAAKVSQPTVIRFCRSLGCKGLSDFKLRLASGLAVSVPVTHSQVMHTDTALEQGLKVLSNTANAILQMQAQMQRDVIERAIRLLDQAQRVDIFAPLPYQTVAQEAQLKLLALGIPCAVYCEPQLQRLTVQTALAGTMALIIAGDQPSEFADLYAALSARPLRILLISTTPSPLAAKADVALMIDQAELTTTLFTLGNRILHLLLIDILTVGLGRQRQQQTIRPDQAPAGRAGGTAADIRLTAGTIAPVPMVPAQGVRIASAAE